MRQKSHKSFITLLIALVGLPQISETIYTPALPAVTAGLATNAHLTEATLSIYFLGFALGVALWGIVSDKIGRRSTMIIGLLLYCLATYFCGAATDVASLMAWRFVQALGASVGSVITQTILRDSYEGAERSRIFAIMSAALAFSPALGPLLGGYISEYMGWRANFWFLTAVAGCLIAWTIMTLPETRPKNLERITLTKLASLCKKMIFSEALWSHILLIGATNGIIFVFYQEAPFIFIEQLGMQPSHYGLFGILIASATVCAARLSYWLCATITAESLIRWGVLCSLVGAWIFIATVISNLLYIPFIGIIAVSTALFTLFIGIGLIIPNSLSIALKPFHAVAGSAGSIFGACYYCLIALCTALMSLMHDGSALPLPLLIVLLTTVLTLACLLLPQPQKVTA